MDKCLLVKPKDMASAGVRDVVFFMHGILDTSMGWVANGTGSQAFAAYDQGMDVWLGSSRSNPPRDHIGQVIYNTLPMVLLQSYLQINVKFAIYS